MAKKTTKPKTKTTARKAAKPAAKAAKPAVKPAAKPLVKPAPKPAVKPVTVEPVKDAAAEAGKSIGKRQKERFRKLLLQQMEQLRGKAVGAAGQMANDSENLPDITDRASAEADLNFELKVQDRERKLILKIQEALDRIEDDTFGICEVCGEPIDTKRLEARPVTTYCIDCKIEQEREEKMRGE